MARLASDDRVRRLPPLAVVVGMAAAALGLSSCSQPSFPIFYRFSDAATVDVLLPMCGDDRSPPGSLSLGDATRSDDEPRTELSAQEGDVSIETEAIGPFWRISLDTADIPNPEGTTVLRVISQDQEVSWLGYVILDMPRPDIVGVDARGDFEGFPEIADYSAAPATAASIAAACDV